MSTSNDMFGLGLAAKREPEKAADETKEEPAEKKEQ